MHRKASRSIIVLTLLLQAVGGTLIAENNITSAENPQNVSPTQPFESFTGRVTKNKVRMRLQPSLDASIIQEFARDDLVMVVGDADDFYAILPPKGSKAYVFRTFVLDNKVEGNKVNVRLEPALEAPVIAQLHSGDTIEGTVSALNNKWLEISPPDSTRFYICKEYVEKIGSPMLMAQIERRREEVNELLDRSYQLSQEELQKNYIEMKLDPAINGFKKIVKEFSDFPDQSARAKELLANVQEIVLQKKIEYLEAKAASKEAPASAFKEQPMASIPPTKTDGDEGDRFALTSPSDEPSTPNWNKLFDPTAMTSKMAAWIPNEKSLYNKWASAQTNPSPEAFYLQQFDDMTTFTGILEPFTRAVKNKPGDFLLLSSTSNLPIAYLYSTNVNLQNKLGQVVTVHAVERPNNNFAFRAFFVISME